ncbi:hypothetical protein OCC_07701 [Thermococcus litoralis DSM 5473]|uniref:Uncharacterized protein n=1 Tax=Thermococcus litoralis (strain ATCC 51850 / DSM 5473 / JCM 8560 / NS-C) TaxID=523849 RepID=H3ZL27_THELN|nr:hypothetical protein [Thermococcus litoralis]EHR79366.1 hypothetical protein OCC_07701 [Thermococcus litoralis DSM 5473]
MRTRDVIILASWLAAIVLSTVIILKGGANYSNIGIAIVLFLMAAGISYSVGYSLHDREEIKTANEISRLVSKLEGIEKRLETIEGKVEKVERFLEE